MSFYIVEIDDAIYVDESPEVNVIEFSESEFDLQVKADVLNNENRGFYYYVKETITPSKKLEKKTDLQSRQQTYDVILQKFNEGKFSTTEYNYSNSDMKCALGKLIFPI